MFVGTDDGVESGTRSKATRINRLQFADPTARACAALAVPTSGPVRRVRVRDSREIGARHSASTGCCRAMIPVFPPLARPARAPYMLTM